MIIRYCKRPRSFGEASLRSVLAVSLLAMTAVLFLAGCANNGIISKTYLMMGSTADISAAGPISKEAKIAAIDKAFERIRQIERLMSFYDSRSDVSNINNFADIRPIEVSDDTIKVLKRADEINKITGGAFDITVAPLVELWGFGPGGARLKIPAERDIKEALKLVGADNLKIDYARKTVRFMRRGMKIDLGGIAAGYAVDCAIESLKENGIKNAMVNIGGEVSCIGTSGPGRSWRIGIQHPRVKSELLAMVDIKNKAISTSGDYENFFFQGKKRISHIINPHTGMPVSDVPASVSIIAPDCVTADALATAVFVLGPEKGMSILNKMASVSGMIAVSDNNRIKIYKTDGFGKQ